MINAKRIEQVVKTGAAHVLYREDGKWYHHLKKFPAVLFDSEGMIRFETKQDYLNNTYLRHGKDLHVDGGISIIPGYKKFSKKVLTEIEKLRQRMPLINELDSWSAFLKVAQSHVAAKEIFISPVKHRKYQITSVFNGLLTVKRIDKPGSNGVIGKKLFFECIRNINMNGLPLKKGAIYNNVLIESTIVELLPMLDWSEDGQQIVLNDFLQPPYSNGYGEISEAKNDDISKRRAVLLKVRKGQKKLREKLLYLYSGKCALSGCAVKEVLHACHIAAFASTGNNMSTNAILLRSDIHDLFDANLLAVEPETNLICVHVSLKDSEYFQFNGKILRPRLDGKDFDAKYLKLRWKLFRQITK